MTKELGMHDVRVVAITKPIIEGVEDIQHLIAYAARVSNPQNQSSEEYANLTKYLMDNQHWSPFEMANATLEIHTTRTIARQILRHRSCAFQEFSGRYAEMPSDFVSTTARTQHPTNRQKSVKTDDQNLIDWWEDTQQHVFSTMKYAYDEAIKRGVAKEVARNILPEGATQSTMFVQGSIRSWIHYCALRTGNGTQLEHVQVAQACCDALSEHLPNIFSSSVGSEEIPQNLAEDQEAVTPSPSDHIMRANH